MLCCSPDLRDLDFVPELSVPQKGFQIGWHYAMIGGEWT